jgi:hypothetical protein
MSISLLCDEVAASCEVLDKGISSASALAADDETASKEEETLMKVSEIEEEEEELDALTDGPAASIEAASASASNGDSKE